VSEGRVDFRVDTFCSQSRSCRFPSKLTVWSGRATIVVLPAPAQMPSRLVTVYHDEDDKESSSSRLQSRPAEGD